MADDQSFFNNRGKLEESLYTTAKLLETLDKNNGLEEVSEVNFLLAGMEGLIGQFSENQYDMQHEIQEMLESSRQGLLTHEKLVEMITAEQIRSRYLNSIVSSLRDQIENLFNTIMNKEDDDDEATNLEFMDKVSSNVSLMWKQVDSLSKVISSPTKKLDQTIRKIDSEVVVHLNKSFHSPEKRENFAEKIDKQLEKVKAKTPTTTSKLKMVEEAPKESDDGDTFQTSVPSINRKDKGPPSKEKGKKKTAEDYMNDLENELDASHTAGRGTGSKSTDKHPDHTHSTPLTSARLDSASHSERDSAHNRHTSADHLAAASHHSDADESSLEELVTHDDDDNDHELDHHGTTGGHGKGHKKKKGKGHARHSANTPSNKGSSKSSKKPAEGLDKLLELRQHDDNVGNGGGSGRAGGARRRSFDKPGNVDIHRTGSNDSRDRDHPVSARPTPSSQNIRSSNAITSSDAHVTSGNSTHVTNGNSAHVSSGSSGYSDNSRAQSSSVINNANDHSHRPVSTGTNNLLATSILNRPHAITTIETERQAALEGESPTHRRLSITPKSNDLPHTKIADDEISLGSSKPVDHVDPVDGWPKEREAFIKAMQIQEKELQTKYADIERIVREKLLQAMKFTQIDNNTAKAGENNSSSNNAKSPNMDDLQQKLQLLLQQTSARNQFSSVQVDKNAIKSSLSAENSNSSSAHQLLVMSDDTPTSRTVDSAHHNLRTSLPNIPSVMSEGIAVPSNELMESTVQSRDQVLKALSRSLQLSNSTQWDPQQLMTYLTKQMEALERGEVELEEDEEVVNGNESSPTKIRVSKKKISLKTDKTTDKQAQSNKDTTQNNPLATIKRRLAAHVDESQHVEQIDGLLQTILFNASKSGGKAPDWERIKIGLPSKKITTAEVAINTDHSMGNILGNHHAVNYHSPSHHGVGLGGAFPAHHGTLLPQNLSHTSTVHSHNVSQDQQQVASMMELPPLQGYLPPISTTAVGVNSVGNNNKGSMLPVYDNQQDLLITRTYRMPPEKENFMHMLHNSLDPLLFIYRECKAMLSKDVQAKLLRLAAPLDIDQINAEDQLNMQRWLAIASLLWEQIQVLEQEVEAMTIVISDLETISQDAIMIIKAARKSGRITPSATKNSFTIADNEINLMESHLFDVNRLFGELEARLLSANLQQLEHRSLFQSLQAKGIKELPSLCKNIPDLKNSFDIAQKNQGLLYEIQQRLLLCRDRCKRYELFKYLPYQGDGSGLMMSAGEGFVSRHNSSGFLPALVVQPPRPDSSNNNRLHKFERVANNADAEAMVFDQQEQIKQLTEEVEDLEMELMELVKERDHTPDAILFYSLMHDPAYVSNLQQLCLQLKNIRGFLDYSVRMDYQTLRKRLSVCMVLLPTVEKLVESYGLQYKQWSKFRQNWFAERNLRGGSAEGLATCPLCYKSLLEDDNEKKNTEQEKQPVATKAKKKLGQYKTMSASLNALDSDLFGSSSNKPEKNDAKSNKLSAAQKQTLQQARQQKVDEIPQINLTASIKAIRDRS